MPQTQADGSHTSSNQRLGLLIAGGLGLGLGAYAVWYIRRQNLARKPAPPPRAQLDMTPLKRAGHDEGSEDQGAASSAGAAREKSAAGPPPGTNETAAEKSGANGANGQHARSAESKSNAESSGPSANHLSDRDLGSDSLRPYGWAQTPEEAYLVTTCPLDVKAKEVHCRIQPGSLQLSVRGKSIAAGQLYAPVNSSESIWELENLKDQKKLTVTLVKANGCRGEPPEWPALLKDNPMPALASITA